MNKILFMLFIVFPLWFLQSQEQHTYGPVKENIFSSWVKPTSGTPYYWVDDHLVGTLLYEGRIWETRNINFWEWTYNNIPVEATVTSVVIKFRAYYPYNENFQFSLHNIAHRYNSSGVNFFNECATNNKIYEATLSRDQQGYYYFNQSFQSGLVFDAVKNAVISGNYFLTLGIKLNSNSMPVPPYKISGYYGGTSTQPAIELTIDYTTPNQNYQLINRIQTNENYGNLIVDNDVNNPIPSGTTKFFPWRSQHTIRTAELPFIVNWLNSGTTQKYNYWDLITKEYTINRSITAIPSTPSVFKAKFDQTYSGTISSHLLEDGSSSTGNIEFRDPWRYYKDANNDWFQSNQFVTYNAPLVITNNTADSYGGVFLNQNPPTNPGEIKPYYSVRAPQVQNIGGYNANFAFWTATGPGQTVVTNPTSLESPVIFKGANDVVKAVYKGHMLSSSPNATGPNNQRKIAKWQSSLWFAVYESGNIIWFTESTNAGQTWSNEIPISDLIHPARNPAIAVTSTGSPHVVWEIYEDNGYRVMYRYKHYGLWSSTKDLTPDQTFMAYPSSVVEQNPSIVAWDVVAAVWSHNGHLAFAIEPQNPASQSFGGGDPYNLGTVAFPSIASGYSSSFDFVWSEGANKQIFLQSIIRDNITGSVTFGSITNLTSSYTFLSDCNNPSISVTGLNKHISFSAIDNRYSGGTTRSINYIEISNITNSVVDYRSWGQPNIIYDYPSITYNFTVNKSIIAFSDVTNRRSMWVDNTPGSVPKVLQTESQSPLTIEMDNPVMTFLLTLGNQAPYKLQFKKQQLTTVVSLVNAGWNLNSVPVDVWNFAKNAVWPTSNSPSYWYQPGVGFVIRDTLENRPGYWIKFPSNQSVPYYGVPIESLHISVKTGWNMIGSISIPFDTTKIYPVGTARISSIYKYHNGGYSIADTIKPGSGYWIKVSTNGILVLNSSTPGSTTPGGCQNNEPPPPPGAPPTPTLSSPANGSTGVSIYPTLTWNTSEGASSYILQVASDVCFNYIVFRDSTLTTTSKQIGPLNYSSTHYWRVKASSGNLRSDWSSVRSFVTQSAPGGFDPCEPYASLSATDQFNVSDASGNNQSFYVRNGSKPFIPNFGTLDMPPEPPKGIFKARFKSGKFIETILPDKVSKKIPIIIKDVQYPVEFSWAIKDDNKITYWVKNPDNNKKIQLSASGKITINDKKGEELKFEALARAPICVQPVYKISEGENIQIPTTYSLSQNYPNPFNPVTQINYALPDAGYVTLKVYDVLGREVAVLVDGYKEAGYYETTWDATNVPSGVFFYKLQVGSFTSVKKMILMR